MSLQTRSWMLGAVLGTLIGFLSIWNFRAEEKPLAVAEDNPRELYRIAESQIAAFRRNDYSTAYTFAASGIRQKFPLEQFSAMVRQTYPHLTHSGRLNFGEARFDTNLHASAMIYVSHRNGEVPMIYGFVRENGLWKIEGVQMLGTETLGRQLASPQT